MATNAELQALVKELQKENMILKQKLSNKKSKSKTPQTSKDSYELIKLTEDSVLHELLMAYSEKAMTDEEVAHECGLLKENSRDMYWSRCSKLRTDGLIKKTGITRPGASKRQRMVCEITPAGLSAIGKVRVVQR